MFFTSADQFLASFDYKEGVDKVTIVVHRARVWDITAIGALDKTVIRFRREGTEVDVIGLDEASATQLLGTIPYCKSHRTAIASFGDECLKRFVFHEV